MKKKRKVFLVICACLCLSMVTFLKADSGWDGDYDSSGGGSSWGSEGSSWNSGGSHHNSGSSGTRRPSSDDSDVTAASIVVGVIFISLTVVLLLYALNKKSNKNNGSFSEYNYGYDLDKIREIIPGFDAESFKNSVFEIYKNIQVAWMNFDYETLEKYTTNELYNLYKSELTALSLKKQKNIMENFSLLSFRITDLEKGTNDVSIKVRMHVTCKDYVVDKDNHVVRGNKNRYIRYEYEMTFTKGLNVKDNKCPNCNAPLENVQTSVCPYCGSTVISDNHDYVLSKKQVISQR